MGAYCNLGGRAEPLHAQLCAAFGEPGPAFMARGPVSWEVASCLDMCGAGPNLILYPEDEAHHALDAERLQQIIGRLRDERGGEGT